ncbi:ATP-binding cassette domain-containing protein [Kolteria novifilia]|uniref:ABC transporter ATP-binding protein n=1 Tax=Kolteria novifilia TaxID=2527975 RepID=UPI003AF3AD48
MSHSSAQEAQTPVRTPSSGAGDAAVLVQGLCHRYDERLALDHLDLDVRRGESFALLGPNGGGKTTLFRILTTYFPVQQGRVRVLAYDLPNDRDRLRHEIGVVFQHPSLDGKLTVEENLAYHGRLHGLDRKTIRRRSEEMLDRLGLLDRRRERVEKLSGGLARRVELAKGMLHEPKLLILDEPSTGLDPGARRDLWVYLTYLRNEGVTLLTTTHLLDEAERCDRVGIIHQGRLIAKGSPNELRSEIGGDVVTLRGADPAGLAAKLHRELKVDASVVNDTVRIESDSGFALLGQIGQCAASEIESMAVSKPTLEDVFIHRTGHRFWGEPDE